MCSNLPIRHLVNRLNTDDASSEFLIGKPLLKFALCFTRTNNQDTFCVTDTCNYRIVVNVEMASEVQLGPRLEKT